MIWKQHEQAPLLDKSIISWMLVDGHAKLLFFFWPIDVGEANLAKGPKMS